MVTMERPTSAPASPKEMSEEELMKAENTLRDMYQQVRHLRSTMPRIIGAFTAEHDSPQSLYDQLEEAALTANKDLKKFNETMKAPENKNIFEHCQASKAKNPADITPWRITLDPDWNKKQ